jgi:uncharacterized protein
MSYIDTCVLVAYYCAEPLSGAAQKAIRGAHEAVLSPLVEVEFCSALAIKVRTGDLDAKEAARIASIFKQHLGEGSFRSVPMESLHYTLARDWIVRLDVPLRTLDALHLAVAFTNRLPILTSDRDLIRAARHFGVKHKLVS